MIKIYHCFWKVLVIYKLWSFFLVGCTFSIFKKQFVETLFLVYNIKNILRIVILKDFLTFLIMNGKNMIKSVKRYPNSKNNSSTNQII